MLNREEGADVVGTVSIVTIEFVEVLAFERGLTPARKLFCDTILPKWVLEAESGR
jgi:hypothetical protein